MKTGRIVELTLAVGAGGVAACLASVSDSRHLRSGPVAQCRSGTVATVGSGIFSSVVQP